MTGASELGAGARLLASLRLQHDIPARGAPRVSQGRPSRSVIEGSRVERGHGRGGGSQGRPDGDRKAPKAEKLSNVLRRGFRER